MAVLRLDVERIKSVWEMHGHGPLIGFDGKFILSILIRLDARHQVTCIYLHTGDSAFA